MTNPPAGLRYSKDHEWYDPSAGRVGITDHAQSALGDVVFCELPKVGKVVVAGDPVAVVESVKSVSDLYAPVAGRVRRANDLLRERPQLVNEDPYGEGWFLELEAATAGGAAPTPETIEDGLLDAEGYRALLAK